MSARRALVLFTALAGAAAIAAVVAAGADSVASGPLAGAAASGRSSWRAAVLLAEDEARRGTAEAGRFAVDMGVRWGAPVLAEWLTSSREAAIAAGVEPVPPAMEERLRGFFPAELLRRVHFRVGFPAGAAPGMRLFRLLDARAVTLIDVIVFRDQAIAADPVLWAHELTHVQQVAKLGVAGFAGRYIAHRDEVEGEAWDAAADYTMWALEHGNR